MNLSCQSACELVLSALGWSPLMWYVLADLNPCLFMLHPSVTPSDGSLSAQHLSFKSSWNAMPMQGFKRWTESGLKEPEASSMKFFLRELRIESWSFLVASGFEQSCVLHGELYLHLENHPPPLPSDWLCDLGRVAWPLWALVSSCENWK